MNAHESNGACDLVNKAKPEVILSYVVTLKKIVRTAISLTLLIKHSLKYLTILEKEFETNDSKTNDKIQTTHSAKTKVGRKF